jgi:hypothetical protein
MNPQGLKLDDLLGFIRQFQCLNKSLKWSSLKLFGQTISD